MNTIPKAPKPTNPVMIDRAISYIQDALISEIGWLDHAFGRAHTLVTKQEQNIYTFPAIYIGDNEYLNVLPGQEVGNRIFFVVGDPQTLNFKPRRYNVINSPISLICWYDLSRIYADSSERNTEEIKRQILRFLTNLIMPNATRLTVEEIYEKAENIFRGYSIREIDTQYLMQPFAGIRIDGTLTYREDCI